MSTETVQNLKISLQTYTYMQAVDLTCTDGVQFFIAKQF